MSRTYKLQEVCAVDRQEIKEPGEAALSRGLLRHLWILEGRLPHKQVIRYPSSSPNIRALLAWHALHMQQTACSSLA